MEAISQQLKQLFDQADAEGRRKLQDELRDLQTSLDTQWDVVIRLASGTLQMPLVKIGTDIHIFEKLAASEKLVGLEELAKPVGADPILLRHVLRALASFGLVKETGKDTWAANRTTHALADVNVAGAVDHAFDVHGPVAHALPYWLKSHNYQMITSNKDLPFHVALKTDLTPFEWMKQHPEQMKGLGHAMAIQRSSFWGESYPIEKEVGDFSAEEASALLVDIGGGFGQQAQAFQKEFPALEGRGRVVVQDIPETLSKAPKVDGMEFMVQDFFQPQQIKGAKFYYLRHILHDWTDEDCVKILKNIVPAMGSESKIVIDEIVFPETGAPWQAAYMDLTMLGALGGIERTREEFEGIMDRAGLKISNMHRYDDKGLSVILAAPK